MKKKILMILTIVLTFFCIENVHAAEKAVCHYVNKTNENQYFDLEVKLNYNGVATSANLSISQFVFYGDGQVAKYNTKKGCEGKAFLSDNNVIQFYTTDAELQILASGITVTSYFVKNDEKKVEYTDPNCENPKSTLENGIKNNLDPLVEQYNKYECDNRATITCKTVVENIETEKKSLINKYNKFVSNNCFDKNDSTFTNIKAKIDSYKYTAKDVGDLNDKDPKYTNTCEYTVGSETFRMNVVTNKAGVAISATNTETKYKISTGNFVSEYNLYGKCPKNAGATKNNFVYFGNGDLSSVETDPGEYTPIVESGGMTDYWENDYFYEYELADVNSLCDNENYKIVTKYIGWIFGVVWILVPLVVIGMGLLEFYKAITSSKPEELSKAFRKVIIKVIAGILIFFIPSIITFGFTLVEDWRGSESAYKKCTKCLFDPKSC